MQASCIVNHNRQHYNPKATSQITTKQTVQAEMAPESPKDPAKSRFLMKTLSKFKTQEVVLAPSPRMVLNVNKHKKPCEIPEIKDINTHRVTFDPATYESEPPQQIPARVPRTGTVKITEEGFIVRPHNITDVFNPENGYRAATEAATTAAYNAATTVAKVVKDQSSRLLTMRSNKAHHSNCEEPDLSESSTPIQSNVQIDTPMHGSSGFSSAPKAPTSETPPNSGFVDLYTKCCHLREILPINATLVQLEGQSGVLPSLRQVNHRPTLIEVLSLSDFISIAPINTIVFKNLDVTDEMFRNLILSLTRSTTLKRLSLVNANITFNDWKILCAFLLANKSLTRLDISVIAPAEGKKPVRYKQAPVVDRADLDWELFTKTLICRGGIEELIINGCLVPHDAFRDLITKACLLATKRLGVASSDLQEDDIAAIYDWLTQTNCICEGLDVGGNDLHNSEDMLSKIFSQASIQYLSLNSCKLASANVLDTIFKHKNYDSKLRFLDLSYNPGLFPTFINSLEKYLPRFQNLRRIHLDHNSLKAQDIIKLSEALAKCPSIDHVSLFGNRDINDAAIEALAVAVRLSHTITIVEIDADLVPANIGRRLSHYCLLNMEEIVDPTKHDKQDNFDDEGELLDDGKTLAKAVKYVIDTNKKQPKKDPEHPQLVANGLALRARTVRDKVRKILEQLSQETVANEMKPEIRDKLIRMYTLESTLDAVLERYVKSQQQVKTQPYPTPHERSAKLQHSAAKAESLLETGQPVYSDPLLAHLANHSGLASHESEVQLLRDNSPVSEDNHKRQQEREEGDFHKLGFFISSSKQLPAAENPPSGNQLRQLLLTESNSRANSIYEAEGAISSPGTRPNSRGGTTPGTPGVGAQDDKTIEKFISKLKSMSDNEIHDYFKNMYCNLPSEDASTSDDSSYEEPDEQSSTGVSIKENGSVKHAQHINVKEVQ